MSEAGGVPPEEWQRTSPLGFVVGAILSLRNAAVPTLAALIGTGAFSRGWIVIIPTLLAMGFVTALFSYLAWRHFRYRIGESDIRVERGLFSRSARSVPYERVQDVSLEQGLVPRLFGMVEVKFETGAGGKDEVRIRYVSAAEGEALREMVRTRKSDEESTPGHPTVAKYPSRDLFAMDLKRLATFGLFEFSLVAFAVLAGAAQQFDFLLPIDIWASSDWIDLVGGPGHWLQEAGLAAQAIGLVFAIAAVSLVGLATGFIRTFLRDYGFRLEETPKGLRRRRGLITRTDVVMPPHRVQALKLGTGIVRRRFGWHDLSVVSLAQDAKAGNHIVVPFATLDEIAPVVAAAGFALPTPDSAWHRPSRRHRIDRALLFLVPLSLAAIAVVGGGDWLGVPSPATLPVVAGLLGFASLILLRAHFRWRHDCHAIGDTYIFIRQGWFAPRLEIASRLKLQSAEIVQGPLARRRGYADVRFGLAGGKLQIAGVSLADARTIRSAVIDTVARVDFSHA